MMKELSGTFTDYLMKLRVDFEAWGCDGHYQISSK